MGIGGFIVSVVIAGVITFVIETDVQARNKALLRRQQYKTRLTGRVVTHKLLKQEFIITDVKYKCLSKYPYVIMDIDFICRESDGTTKLFNQKELELVKS